MTYEGRRKSSCLIVDISPNLILYFSSANVQIFSLRGRARPAYEPERGIPSVHPSAAGVQVLVLGNQGASAAAAAPNVLAPPHHAPPDNLPPPGHLHRLRLYLLSTVQHPGVLADPRHVLHHTLLYHHEAADQGNLCLYLFIYLFILSCSSLPDLLTSSTRPVLLPPFVN